MRSRLEPETDFFQKHAFDFKFGLPTMMRDYFAVPGTTVDLERGLAWQGTW